MTANKQRYALNNRLSDVLKENKNNKSKIKKKCKCSMVQQKYLTVGDTYQNIVVGNQENIGSAGMEKIGKKQRELVRLLMDVSKNK